MLVERPKGRPTSKYVKRQCARLLPPCFVHCLHFGKVAVSAVRPHKSPIGPGLAHRPNRPGFWDLGPCSWVLGPCPWVLGPCSPLLLGFGALLLTFGGKAPNFWGKAPNFWSWAMWDPGPYWPQAMWPFVHKRIMGFGQGPCLGERLLGFEPNP